MSIFTKSLDDVTKQDLEDLIRDGYRENLEVEYKSQAYGDDKRGKTELLKDVTAFANSQGGLLIVGIEEKHGKPFFLNGIENADRFKDKTRDIINSSIRERIQNVTIKLVEVGPAKHVVIIRVPRSIRQPHMFHIEGRDFPFYQRHHDSNTPMDISEIKQAVLVGQNMKQRIDDIVEAEKIEAKRDNSIGIICHLFVVPVFQTDLQLDTELENIAKIIRESSQPGASPDGEGLSFREIRHFIHGIEGVNTLPRDDSLLQRMRLKENSVITFINKDTVDFKNREINYLIGPNILRYMINFFRLAANIYQAMSVGGPFRVGVNIFCTQSPYLFIRHGRFSDDVSEKYRDNDLCVPLKSFADLGDTVAITRSLLDHLWRAFNYKKCDYFDDEGNLLPVPRV
ncbi:MAG: ATP-binding protein [Deltaproteobacteria bacterium]|nr:ATP-binding protein [Deltaproteobacteria bacterium]